MSRFTNRLALTILLSILLRSGLSCGSTASRIQVQDLDPLDPELVGAKQVGIRVDAGSNHILQSGEAVKLTYWLAGDNASSSTLNFNGNGEAIATFQIQLPGSETLEICKAMYYMWTVTYEDSQGVRGIYFGSTKLLMPTKEVRNGQIEEAMCAAPPSASE